MELQVALIGVGVFVVSGIILLLISMFGMKEKSYEEAIAEQRQQTNFLLGHPAKPKPKETKKQKKAGKKVKEKLNSQTVEKDVAEDSENAESTSTDTITPEHHGHDHGKLHVEFNKEPAVVVLDPSKDVQIVPNKKRNKKEKVRHILINKEKPAEVIIPPLDDDVEVSSANHFEQLHPKDEFELKHSHLKEEVPKQDAAKDSPKTHLPKDKTKGKNNENKKDKVNKQSNIVDAPQMADLVIAETLLKEPEVVAMTIAATQQPVIPIVAKDKKKKKSDNNTLQQLVGDKGGIVNLEDLLNLVRKAELSRSEVQILIDLLLNKQHEAPAVIDEWTEGKADPVQKLKKQLADKEKALLDEQEALAGAQAKLREVRNEQNSERSHLQQRIRSLDETLQGKAIEVQQLNGRIHSLNQKMSQMQGQMNEENMKMRQVREELNHMQMKMAQHQEIERAKKDLEKHYQELQEIHAQQNNELLSLREQLNVTKDQIMHAQFGLKKELEQKDDYIRQLDNQLIETNHRLTKVLTAEAEAKSENAQLSMVIRKSIEDIKIVQKQKEDAENYIAQLKVNIQKLEDEKVQLEKCKVNGSVEGSKAHQIELLNLHNEVSSLRKQLQQTEKQNSVDVERTIEKLQKDLEEQKSKNNELRQKNWKVVEALNAAESRANSYSKNTNTDIEAEILKVQKQEQQNHRKVIERLFPDLNVSDNASQEDWFKALQKTVQNISNAKQNTSVCNQEVGVLKEEIQRYKSAIDESENILTALQAHVEQEELNWRSKLQEKEKELQQIRNQQNMQLLNQVGELRQQLKEEQNRRDQLECQLKSQQSVISSEHIEIINRLQEQLALEKKRSMDTLEAQPDTYSISIKSQNHNATNGTVLPVQLFTTSTTSSSAASSLTEVALKPKNKKKKKKNSTK